MNISKQDKLKKEYQKIFAAFIERESNKTSLITVTRCELSNDYKNLTVYFSVFPENQEDKVLAFLSRNKKEARDYLKKNISTRILPFVNFAIDEGEKNRQQIDQILIKDKLK